MSKGLYLKVSKLDRSPYKDIFSKANGLPNVVIYIRVSTDEQAEKGYSLEMQEEKIKTYCDKQFGFGKFNALVISEEGRSGRLDFQPTTEAPKDFRHGLGLAVNLVKGGLVQYFIVYKISRLARDTAVFLDVLEMLKRYKTKFVSVVENINVDNPSGRVIASFLAIMAQHESDNIRQHSGDTVRHLIAGGHFHGALGYGWKWEDREKRPDERHIGIEPVPEKAEIVRRIYKWFLSGRNPYWIARELGRIGITSSKGLPNWSDCIVRSILRNPLHCGYTWDQPRYNNDGEQNKGRKIIVGQHFDRRIIDKTEYDAALLRLSLASKSGSTQRSVVHLLGGLVRCGVCGALMSAQKRSPGQPRYVCYGRAVGSEHKRFSVPIKIIDDRVVQELAQLVTSPVILETAKEVLEKRIYAQEHELEIREKDLEGRLAIMDQSLVDLFDQRHQFSQSEYEMLQRSLHTQRESVETDLSSIKDRQKQREDLEIRFRKGLQGLRTFRVWDRLDIYQKKAVMENMVDELIFYPSDRVVDVRLKLILSDAIEFQAPIRGELNHFPIGISSLSTTELVTAYYLRSGLSEREIAARREMMVDTIYAHRARIIRCTDAFDLSKALATLSPQLDARKDDLLLHTRAKRSLKPLLSKTEIAILSLAAKGLSTREIAEKRSTSAHTVAKQFQHIYDKLEVHNRAQAIRKASAMRLVPGAAKWNDAPTEKQMAVLRKLAQNSSQPKAAMELGMSLSALKERLKCMYRKFGVNRLADLLEVAVERVWLEG